MAHGYSIVGDSPAEAWSLSDEAKKRLAHLDAHGPTQFAFTFKKTFKPDEEFQAGIDWSSFVPWPAV